MYTSIAHGASLSCSFFPLKMIVYKNSLVMKKIHMQYWTGAFCQPADVPEHLYIYRLTEYFYMSGLMALGVAPAIS